MSRGVNKCIIIGNLGKDPEIRYAASGTAVANISVATTYKHGDNEHCEWHRVVCFGKVAEICERFLKKGSQAYFEGRIQTRKWQDQQGNDRYSTEIVAHDMQMLGSRNGPEGSHSQAQSSQRPQQREMRDDDGPVKQPPLDDGFDDIPF